MSSDDKPQGSPGSKKDIVGQPGLIAGSAASIIGALLVLIGFVLPWASCGNYRISGLDIVTQSTSGDLESNGTLLCLVPFFAIGILGIAIATVPTALWKKIPAAFRTIGMGLISLLAVLACFPSSLFFANLQSARNDPNHIGGLVQIEYGFWVSMFGLFVAFLGGLLGLGTSFVEKTTFTAKEDEVGIAPRAKKNGGRSFRG